MRLGEIMTHGVRTARRTDRLEDVRRELEQNQIHHLVVMEHGAPVGVVSAHDLAGRDGGSVEEAMNHEPVVATSKTTIKQAANLLRGHGIGCLPVVDDGKLVGIVTTADLLDLIGRSAWKGPVGQQKPMWRRGPRRKPYTAAKKGKAKA